MSDSPKKPSSSSSSSPPSSPPPPPPPPPPPAPTGPVAGDEGGGSGEGSSRVRKRGRNEGAGGASSSVVGTGADENKRKKGELIDVPSTEPICGICGKSFASWKGYFGHLRAHPEREWRGAFPPPKPETAATGTGADAELDDLAKQMLAPTLLDLARETLVKMRCDIDLNKEPPKSGSPSPPPPPPEGGDDEGKGGFDLNMPPPPENDSDE